MKKMDGCPPDTQCNPSHYDGVIWSGKYKSFFFFQWLRSSVLVLTLQNLEILEKYHFSLGPLKSENMQFDERFMFQNKMSTFPVLYFNIPWTSDQCSKNCGTNFKR